MRTRRRSYRSLRKYAPSTPPTTCANAASATSRGAPVSAHQSRNVLRKPCGVVAECKPQRFSKAAKAPSESGLFWLYGVGKSSRIRRPAVWRLPKLPARPSIAVRDARAALSCAQRHAPFLALEVDLSPLRAARFAVPYGRENDEAEASLCSPRSRAGVYPFQCVGNFR